MKNLPEIRIGLIAGSTDWMPQDVAVANRQKLMARFREVYGDEPVYECPIVITDNEVSVKRAAKDVQKAECNAVALYYANYGPESAGTLFADRFEGPVMLFGGAEEGEEPFSRERKDAMTGLINACYALKLRGTNAYIPDSPVGTIAQCADMLHEFLAISKTLIALKDLKVISIGPRPSSYLAACAPNHLLYDLGIEIAEYSELELFNSFCKHAGDARIEKVASEMAEELGQSGNKYPSSLEKFAQYEVTIEDWIRNHKGNRKLVTMTSTCWPAFPLNFGFVPCYVNSRLTGKGFPVACEVDVYGAVSEFIGQSISDDIVTILNLNNNIPESIFEEKIKGKTFNGKQYSSGDLFLGYHCGVTCSKKMKSCSHELHFVNNLLIGEEQSKGTIQGEVVPGPVTLFRLQGNRDGKLQAYVCQGQVLPVSIDTYGGRGIIAVPEFERFFRNVVLEKQFPNHAAVIFGHYGKELVNILHLLGISEVEYNHPRNVPYKSENIFHTNDNWY